MKKRAIIISILCLCMMFAGCGQKNVAKSKDKVKVVVSIEPIKKFVKDIAKDKVDIETIIPAGTEPHSFEPKVQDLKNLSEADVFLYNGLGMEKWVDSALENVGNEKMVVEKVSKGCEFIKSDEDHDKDEHEEHKHGEYDPHIWLGIKEAEIEIKNVKDVLIKADSKNKDFYEKNYKEVENELKKLYDEYKQKFDSVTNKKFVTGHAAFGYLCRDFNLQQKSVQDVFADGEPSVNKMKELVDYCKENNIKTVFVEDMVSPKVSETLAKEVGAKVKKINTLVGEKDNKSYVDSMKENLEKIYESMK